VVEDSSTIRAMLAVVLQSDPGITVVGQAINGEEGIALAKELKPDLITMDLHMPVMDGIAATRAIMASHPVPIILMTGSSTKEDVALSFEALRAGALAIAAKPSQGGESLEVQWARLIESVKALADVRVVRHRSPAAGASGPATPRQPPRKVVPRAIGIGASAGGPSAVRDLLAAVSPAVAVPILAVQHIAPGFIVGFASWLEGELRGSRGSRKVVVAQSGMVLRGDTVYLAPDGQHLGVTASATVSLSDQPPVGGFRPSASHLFESLALVFGDAAIGVILSGMGSDGVEGLRALRAAGGLVIAQNRESSLVYGMPAAAREAGIVDISLAPAAIGAYLLGSAATAPSP